MHTWIGAIATGLLLAALGCDAVGQAQPSPSAQCREFGALCALADGPLGVCESRSCAAGETPPCLTCTSQH